ncbi:MAG: YcaQ family DNA glycosylase [Deltaproteobacteria bacterium]|nr:YcaQ family DNA glycosylase [Deltaproteobacteria bacterium]
MPSKSKKPRTKAKPELPVLSAKEARTFLVGHHGLRAIEHPRGAAGVRAVLQKLRCIQLDPLEPLGQNADLVALARVDGIRIGDVYAHSYPGHAFEHWAKERCLLPASAFPWYRAESQAGASVHTSWWWQHKRIERLPAGVVERVLEEVRERGPLTAKDLAHHGDVERLNWSGWKSSARAGSMALDVLWTNCQLVVCGRTSSGKLFDLPERAMPKFSTAAPKGEPDAQGKFPRWALLQRVDAAGLLSRAQGATWSTLSQVRKTGLADTLVEEGVLEEVLVEGSPRPYLARRGFRERTFPKDDGRLRILGPLDPLVWDRPLVKDAFGFDYAWEVYKPAHQRRWGWYVVPLLHRGELVGRMEGAIEKDAVRIKKLWGEPGKKLDLDALQAALQRHAEAAGVGKVVVTRRVRK